MRWWFRSTQAVAAAGQELRTLVLVVGVLAIAAPGVACGPGDGAAVAVVRTAGCAARDAAFPCGWPPCQPAAVVPATTIKAKTAVSR